MARFEYRVELRDLGADESDGGDAFVAWLNKLGVDGWQVVDIYVHPDGPGKLTIVLMREKPDARPLTYMREAARAL